MLAVGAVAAVAVASGCGYSAVTATNNTYTGCLQGVAITNVAIGATPPKTWTSNAVDQPEPDRRARGAGRGAGPRAVARVTVVERDRIRRGVFLRRRF